MGKLRVGFMDAGQGDATLLIYPDGSLVLVDCGCLKNSGKVKPEISPVLSHYINKAPGKGLRALVLTHPDLDHYNMVKTMIMNPGVPVERIFISQEPGGYKGPPSLTSWLNSYKVAGKLRTFDAHYSGSVQCPELSLPNGAYGPGITVRFLAANTLNLGKPSANDDSIVLLVTYCGVNLFLMGDATAVTEKFILKKLGAQFDALLAGKRTALKVGHHGSPTSSTDEWLAKIQPQVAFISSDTREFSGTSIPAREVVQRLIDGDWLVDFGDEYEHGFVQYNQDTEMHENPSTTLGLFTSLYELIFLDESGDEEMADADLDAAAMDIDEEIPFKANGTWWWYTIDPETSGPAHPDISVWPTVEWETVRKAATG